MSSDWMDHGPGTMEWDYIFGGNETGLYPDYEKYVITDDQDELIKWTFVHDGGGNYVGQDPYVWNIVNIEIHNAKKCQYILQLENDDSWYLAELDKSMKWTYEGTPVTLTEIDPPKHK